MPRRLGPLVVDSIAAESPRFTAPLVLIHGLWCTAAVWRGFMGYLAHRGWDCHAVRLRGHADGSLPAAAARVRLTDHLDDVQRALRETAAPPIVIGHDLGAWLALQCTAAARTTVALAPVEPTRGLMRSGLLSTWIGRWISPAAGLRAPRGRAAAVYFAQGAPGGTVPESGVLTATRCAPLPPARVPALLVAGEHDRIAPPLEGERLAHTIGATFRCVVGAGHALPWEPGWEQRVSEIHRWLIQTLGEPLLAIAPDDE